MNRFVLLISTFVILFSGIANFTKAENVTITFNESDFIFTRDDNGAVEISSYKLSPLYDNNDAPGLPYIMKDVAVPSGQICRNVSASYSKRLIMSDVDIAPNPLVFTTDYTGPIPRDRVAVCSDSIYPASICEYTGKSNWSSFNSLYLRTCPFIYNVREKNLYFIDSMDVTVETEEESAEPQVRKVRPNFEIEEMAYSRLVNPTAVKAPRKAEKEITVADGDRIEYVIITNEALRASFEPLAKWKKTKGVPSKIITMEEIEEQYTGDRPQMKLKNCLYDLYQNKGLKYVLLGGDGSVVPIQGCYVEAPSTYDFEDNEQKHVEYSMPTDLFYACLKGNLDWNKRKDSIIGDYFYDGVDLNPMIYVTRVPINKAFYANPFAQKIINYELAPQYTHSFLIGGCHMSKRKKNVDKSDVECWGDTMYSKLISPYWNGKRFKFYDTGTDFEGGANYNFIESNIEEQLSKDYNFVQISTHGSETMWSACDDGQKTYYSSMNAGHTGQGNGNMIITTTACTTNAFDNYYMYGTIPNVACLGTTLIRNIAHGTIAYLGCSRAGFFSSKNLGESVSDFSFDYEQNFYRYLFADSTQIDKNYGVIVAKAKADLISSCGGIKSYNRWVQYGLNPLGDPEMPIFTAPPSTFDSITVRANKDNLSITTGVSGCRICVMSADDEGESFYKVSSDVGGVVIPNPPMNCNICVTKQNYIPKQISVKYIQDETICGVTDTQQITDRLKISADVMTIGNQVNTCQTSGNVIFHSGQIHLDSDNVTIESGTTINTNVNLLIGKTNLKSIQNNKNNQ